MITKLKAHVAAVNRANREANLLYNQLVKIFEPLIGQKIEKNDGQLMEKYKKLLPTTPDNCQVYKHTSNYSLAYVVKTSESTNGIAMYHEVVVYIGELDNGVLTKMASQFNAPQDYTEEAVSNARLKYQQAKSLADEARSALYPFGEYDS